MSKKWAANLLKVTVSVALFALLASRVEWDTAAASFRSAAPSYILAALACVVFTPLVAALRWTQAGRAVGMVLPGRLAVRATYSGLFVGQFLPAGVGVDSVRLAVLWQEGVAVRLAAASIVLDRASGIAALVALTLVGLPFLPPLVPPGAVALVLGVVLAAGVAAAAALWIDKLPWTGGVLWARLAPVMQLVRAVRQGLFTRFFGAAFACSVLIHLLSIVGVVSIARGFGFSLELWSLLSISSIALFASLLPVSFNGWGVREGALMVGLASLQVPRETSLLISIVYGLLLVVISLPGGFVVKFGVARPKTDPP